MSHSSFTRNSKFKIAGFFVLLFLSILAIHMLDSRSNLSTEKAITGPHYPSEWMGYQRTFPHKEINHSNYLAAMNQASQMKRETKSFRYDIDWEFEGPTNIGGRITDIVVHPQDETTIWLAGASGGVLKTVDGGNSWTNTFSEADVISIGDLAIDPNNPNVLYAGTGEANASSFSFFGDGIYKSTDGGENWEHSGLAESVYIGRIVVDYNNSSNVFVAACGNLFSPNEDRGIYRSKNGGKDWERILFVNDSTAGIDLLQHPTNPNILYATMWDRIRGLNYRKSFGDGSGVWKSLDGGDSWNELTVGLPTGDDVGRIGIDISKSNPEVLYAFYDMPFQEVRVYKTIDGGQNWTRTSDGILDGMGSSFGWYFGQLRIDPANENNVFVMGVSMYKTTNGGSSWVQTGWDMHVDHHAMIIDDVSGKMYAGNDGGFYTSTNNGLSWKKTNNIGLTQFYDIEIDYQMPNRIYGGTQDNNTIRTLTGSDNDWDRILGGDGFYTIVDYSDNDIIYAEYQWGNLFKSIDGGFDFEYIAGQMENDRKNWSSPLAMDPINPEILYFGTHRVWKTSNGGDFWVSITDDLTDGDDGSTYHTVSTIAVSDVNNNIILAGTDDGRVHITTNAGLDWAEISEGLPKRWITRVETDPFDENTIYVTLSGFRWDESEPHVLMSNDLGQNWIDISSNLPEMPVNIVLCDPEIKGAMFIGTDAGVYYSELYGDKWVNIMDDLPNVPVTAMKIHKPTRKLVIGTYGLSAYSLDLNDIVSIDEQADLSSFEIVLSPNPVSDMLHIQGESSLEHVEIVGLNGQKIFSFDNRNDKSEQIDVSSLSPGIYVVHVSNGNGFSSQKFIKQ